MCLLSRCVSAAKLELNTAASCIQFLGTGREGCTAQGGCLACSSSSASEYLAHCRRGTVFPCSSGRFPLLQTSVPVVKLAFKFPLGFGVTGVGRVGALGWHQHTGGTACIQGLCMEGHQLPPRRSFIKCCHEASANIHILDVTRMTRGQGHFSVRAAVGSCYVGVRYL